MAHKLEYEGDVYIKPVGRGIVLEDSNVFLDEAVELAVGAPLGMGWTGRLRILVEEIAPAEPVTP